MPLFFDARARLLAFVAIMACCGVLTCPARTDASMSAVPLVNNTDDLVGATANWHIHVTTTADLATGDVIRFVLPAVTNAQPFSANQVTTSSLTGITFYSTTGTPSPALGVASTQIEGGRYIIYGYVSSTVPNGTGFSLTFGGITNAAGQLSNLSNLVWTLQAGTLASPQSPMGAFANSKFSATSTPFNLTRAGGALVSDENSSVLVGSTAVGETTSYTFAITASSSIPAGGKVVINFPSEYSLLTATATLSQTISDHTATTLAAMATSSNGSDKRIYLTTAGNPTNAGDVITVTIGGIVNPSTAGVYRPFSMFTTKSNNGLIDGSYMGFEQSDYTGRPMPNDTVHIGGTNTINVAVYKRVNGVNVPLSGAELEQVKVVMGCPDKGFFAGQKWLNNSSVATYRNLLDCNYIVGSEPLDKSSNSFYETFLPPAMKSVPAINGQTVTSTIVFGVPDSNGAITITGGVAGQNAFVHAFSADYESFSPLFTSPAYTTPGFSATGTGYARLKLTAGQNWSFNIEGGQFGSAQNFESGGTKYWPPTIPSMFVASTTAGTTPLISLGSHAFVPADKSLLVTINKAGGAGAINDACVGVKRGGGGLFMPPQDTICQPNYGTDYRFKVPLGAVTIQISRPGFGQPEEYPVAISSATTTKTISIASPTSYISVSVHDSLGNDIGYAPVFAHGSNGFAQGMTNASGTVLLYVSAGTYVVEGFAPGLGQLAARTATVGGSNPSVTFTVDTGSLKTISGSVTVGGSGVAGIKIGAHGTGNTTGGNGTETDANGSYVLYVPAGTYEVGGWSANTGGLPPQSVNVSSANASGINFAVNAAGTLRIIIQNSSNVSPLFGGAFNEQTGRGNGTDSWTATGTGKYADITLPAGTYDIHAGSPVTGELSSPGDTATITASQTTTATYNAAATELVTLSGTVTSTAGNIANATVWASRIAGPGFYSAQTDANGNYSLTVPDGRTYRVGVKISGYVSAAGDVSVAVSGNTTRHFTLVAAGSPIAGQVTGGGAVLSNAWVSAKKTIGSNEVWTGGPTDADGNFSLDVDSGTWTVYAEGPCYARSAGTNATAGDSGISIALTAMSGCAVPVPEINGVTPASGGQVAKGDVVLDIPANALGTDQNVVSVSISTAPYTVATTNASPVEGSVQRITVTNNEGKTVNVQGSISLSLPYDPDALPNGYDESKLQLAYFDTTTGQWESVASTVDTANNLISAQIDHFTDYGPVAEGVPEAPTGLTATAASVSQINLSWTASPTASSYVVYRSTTDSNYTSQIGTTASASYSDTGLSASTRYYYKVAGVNENGEGFNSSSANAQTNAAAASANTGGSAYSSGSRGGSSATGFASPTPTPAPTPAMPSGEPANETPTLSPSVPTIFDPSDSASLVSTLGLIRDASTERAALAQVLADAKEFGLTANEQAASTMTNYVAYGISTATQKLGQGERRAVLRDYFDTVKRTNIVWADIERITNGQIPIARNLEAERTQVATVLPIFIKIYGHAPNFKDAKENLAWNTLMYRIRFPRDLKKESEGINEYRSLYNKNPKSPLGWSIVRVYGYVK